MSARVTFLAAIFVVAGVSGAAAACGDALSQFEKIINSDAATGNLNKGVHKRIAAELVRVQSDCVAGRDAQAMNHLADIKRRFGYR